MKDVIRDILDHLEGINTGLVILCLTVLLMTLMQNACERMTQENKKNYMTECVKTHTPTECALGWKNSGVN